MGSQAKQASLWGQRTEDWSAIQEQTAMAGYVYILDLLKHKIKAGKTLLDIGCGSGLFAQMAGTAGAAVTGLDGTAELVAKAKERAPALSFITSEMEQLPFENNSFDIVTGFNSFQYAENVSNALGEALRVLKPGGILAAMIWGNPQDCEATSFLKAVGPLMPPPPPGAPGPFALTENHLLEDILKKAGFTVTSSKDIPSIWEYSDEATALKGLISSGPVANAIAYSSLERVTEAVTSSIRSYIQPDGKVIYHNKFRIVTAEK